MNVEFLATTQITSYKATSANEGAEALENDRKAVKEGGVFNQPGSTKEKNVQPEELLQNIKSLTENGLYSVRFETNKETNDVVINLIEQETGEVIRQIPPEEILGMRETLENLRGNLVTIES